MQEAGESGATEHALDKAEAMEVEEGVVQNAAGGCIPADSAEDLRVNYRKHIQRVLRCTKRWKGAGGYAHSGIVSLEGLKGLPCISVKKIGRLALPMTVEQGGVLFISFHVVW